MENLYQKAKNSGKRLVSAALDFGDRAFTLQNLCEEGKMNNKLTSLVGLVVLGLGWSALNTTVSNLRDETNAVGSFRGNEIRAYQGPRTRLILIQTNDPFSYLVGKDTSLVGKFDEIYLDGVKLNDVKDVNHESLRNSPLFAYANNDSLNVAYEIVISSTNNRLKTKSDKK